MVLSVIGGVPFLYLGGEEDENKNEDDEKEIKKEQDVKKDKSNNYEIDNKYLNIELISYVLLGIAIGFILSIVVKR